MERIPEKVDSKFRYVLLASCRCEQLMRGGHPKLEMPGAKLTRIAMEEVIEDVVAWGYGPGEEPPQEEADFEETEAELVAETA